MPIYAKDRFAELPPTEQAAIRERADELYAEEVARRLPKGRSTGTKSKLSLPPAPDAKQPAKKLAHSNVNSEKNTRKSRHKPSKRPQT